MNTNLFKEEAIHSNVTNRSNIITTPGIWIDGRVYWVNNGYERLIHEEALSIHMKQEHMHSKMRFHEVYVTNHLDKPRRIKLLLKHSHQNAARDHFSFISPTENVIFHLANNLVFLVNGQANGGQMEQSTVQPYWNVNSEQIWSCTNRGLLKYQPMVKGAAVSIFTLSMDIPAQFTSKASTWVISGTSKWDLLKLNQALLKKTH